MALATRMMTARAAFMMLGAFRAAVEFVVALDCLARVNDADTIGASALHFGHFDGSHARCSFSVGIKASTERRRYTITVGTRDWIERRALSG